MLGPVEGVVALDLTRVLAGPFCTMMLADMGAEVIKVERPEGGDDSRAFGPFVGGESAYFMSVNRGKKSVTLDLKKPRGKELLIELAKKADVLVENFKPGVMKKLGLSYEQLREHNPRLIYAASTGFGQTGPYSARPAYDLVIQGMGGMMSITGPDAQTPTRSQLHRRHPAGIFHHRHPRRVNRPPAHRPGPDGRRGHARCMVAIPRERGRPLLRFGQEPQSHRQPPPVDSRRSATVRPPTG